MLVEVLRVARNFKKTSFMEIKKKHFAKDQQVNFTLRNKRFRASAYKANDSPPGTHEEEPWK